MKNIRQIILFIFSFLKIFCITTSAALKGSDATSGAIGAVVAETAAEALHKDGKDPATTAKQARIIGDTVAFLAGRDVTFADKTGTYEELKKLTRGYGHYIEAHEIPSWAALKHNGSTKPRGENTAIIILRKDHIRTRTYGLKNSEKEFRPPRQELARDIWDIRSIM